MESYFLFYLQTFCNKPLYVFIIMDCNKVDEVYWIFSNI